MRLVRRDNGYVVDPNKNITKLEGVFVLDTIRDMNGAVQGSNYAGNFTAVTATQIQNALNTEGAHIKLYVSEDNHTYAEYTENYTISWQEDVRDYYDANGFLKIEDAKVYVMNITGLNITPDTYVALVISEHVNRLLRTIPYTNLNFYSGDEKLTTSVTHFVRDVWGIGGSTPHNILWGYEREPQHTQGPTLYTEWTDSTGATRRSLYDMFTKYGFEFEYAGAGNGGEGWSTAKVYGMAVGKPQYVGGALCEGYAEVRQHWLDYTIYLLDDCNFDGIEYRMLGHSTFITDPINYGYNQPIVDKYKELYGVDISDPSVTITEEMYIKIMIIRGDFFMMFLDEVEKYTEEHDKFFGMHLIDAYADTSKYYESLKHTGMNSLISPYRPKIIINWKKCIDMCDEVSLKEYTWNNYNVQTCIEIKQYAYQQGKPCWVNVSRVMGEQNVSYVTKVDNDKYIAGIMWYEHPGEAALEQIYAVLGWAQVPIE
ncbi:MAG: hypothetical protein J6U86_06095 [Clostridia bacterium]|nr:hypothetical protein [Clostridia bacterium]